VGKCEIEIFGEEKRLGRQKSAERKIKKRFDSGTLRDNSSKTGAIIRIVYRFGEL
jgi:hypothetical protein